MNEQSNRLFAEAVRETIGAEAADLLASSSQALSGSLSGITNWLRECDAARILLVVDRGALNASKMADELDEALRGVERIEFDAFSPNPRCEEAATAARLAAMRRIDAVIAIGGGSCLDVAKVAALAARSPHLIDDLARGASGEQADPLPLAAVPTTSGTGSEATHFAAIYIDGRKVSVAHPRLRPRAVALDVRFHQAMPPLLAAATGLDALGQAMESLWSVGANERSIQFAAVGGRLVAENLVQSCAERRDTERTRVMIGAHLAGRAINISKTTASHALSYQLTQRFGIAHGHAVALTVGHLAAANADVEQSNCVDPRGAEDVRQRVAIATRLLGVAPMNAPAAVATLLSQLGLPSSLRLAGVSRDALPALAESVDPVRLGNNPRRFSVEELHALLERAF